MYSSDFAVLVDFGFGRGFGDFEFGRPAIRLHDDLFGHRFGNGWRDRRRHATGCQFQGPVVAKVNIPKRPFDPTFEGQVRRTVPSVRVELARFLPVGVLDFLGSARASDPQYLPVVLSFGAGGSSVTTPETASRIKRLKRPGPLAQ